MEGSSGNLIKGNLKVSKEAGLSLSHSVLLQVACLAKVPQGDGHRLQGAWWTPPTPSLS